MLRLFGGCCCLLLLVAGFPADSVPMLVLKGSEPSGPDPLNPIELAQLPSEVLRVTVDQAKCPNLCSGRGRCVVNSSPDAPPENTTICVCDQGWSDYDCSRVVGPIAPKEDGRDCPNHCSSHGVCYRGSSVVLPRCYCDPKWTGADCSNLRETFLLCPNNCSGFGVCTNGYNEKLDSIIAQCLCDKNHGGVDCSVPKKSPCRNSCSGHGNCTASGCVCEPGRLGADCSLEAILTCPNNCSSRGRCVKGQCSCMPGYSGADCSKIAEPVCPENCNGHGLCVASTRYFPGGCRCYDNWSGPACDHQFVNQANCAGGCNGNGFCNEKKLCRCFLGWTGPDCGKRATYSATNLPPELEKVGAVVVHPVLMEGEKKSEEVNQYGILETLPKPTCENNCSSHGVCLEITANASSLYDSSIPNAPSQIDIFICKCDPGYDAADCSIEPAPNSAGGADAAVNPTPLPAALNGGHKSLFAADPVSWDKLPTMAELRNMASGCPNNCSSRGRCLRHANSTKSCSCYTGWDGSDCSVKVPLSYDCNKDCSGHGRCVTASEYFPIHCMCDDGYHGDNCEHRRPPKLVYELHDGFCPNFCSNRGSCINGKCVCMEFGFGGPDCSVPAGGVCEKNCNGNGICFWGDCECLGGWEGQFCDVQPPKPCPNECGMRGKCVGGQCVCLTGYTGDDCSDIMLKCPNQCSGHGSCVEADTRARRPARCECMEDWTGVDCSNFPLDAEIPQAESQPTKAQDFYMNPSGGTPK